MKVITSHMNADFDALASMVAAEEAVSGCQARVPGVPGKEHA